MKRYKWMSIGAFVLAILCIVALHSYFNLIERIKPPSEMWGRDKLVGVTDFKKEPVSSFDGTNNNVIYAAGQGFEWVVFDNAGNEIKRTSFTIEGYKPEKLVRYDGNIKYMLVLQNSDLYYVNIAEGKSSYSWKHLMPDVSDFKLLHSEDGDYIAVYTKTAISVHKLENAALNKLTNDYPVKNTKCVDLKRDENGKLHLVYIAEINSLEYNLLYLTYDSANGQWSSKINPYRIENLSSYSLNNLQLGFDDEDAYIFYELYKTSPKGLVAQTYFSRLPKNANTKVEALFAIVNLNKDQFAGSSYLTSLKCIDEKSDRLGFAVATPVQLSIKREGNEIVYAVMDKGEVVEKQLASNTGQWNTSVDIKKYGNQYCAFFLQTMGRSQYEIRMTFTGEQYRHAANDISKKDMKGAITDTFSGYIFAFFPIFIGFLLVAPALLWPIAVDFFEWKKYYYNDVLTFNVGAAIESVFMFFNMSIIYRNADAVAYMPNILKFTGAKFFYLLLTFVIAYTITRLYKKGSKELHILPQTLIFVFTHLIIVYFLFAKYIAGF